MAGDVAGKPDAGPPPWDEMVLVGSVARPHGLRGHVALNAETDFPEERFAAGSTLWMDGATPTPLVVASLRMQNGRPIVLFDGVDSVERAQALAGRQLRISEQALHPLAPGTYYQHQLVGCVVMDDTGSRVGEVAKVDESAGGNLLVVHGTRGEVLIPLADEICTRVDVQSRRIDVVLPAGLLELNETRRSRRAE